eukprot:343287-Pleurochrysis_carterae.AAC.6
MGDVELRTWELTETCGAMELGKLKQGAEMCRQRRGPDASGQGSDSAAESKLRRFGSTCCENGQLHHSLEVVHAVLSF